MKSRQLLSVVFSLIMFTGVTAGSTAAFAQSDKELEDLLEDFCQMTDQQKNDLYDEYPEIAEFKDRLGEYCELDEDAQDDHLERNRDEYRGQLERISDRTDDSRHEMDYDRLCTLTESERLAEIADPEKLDRISTWCDMTPEERQEFKKEHKDEMGGKDGKSKDKSRNMSDSSPRLKEMIMGKHDISDERSGEIKMKYKEKHGDLTDEKRSELKMKFKDHMSSKKVNMSDERKSEIHERLAEMKGFKSELRERSSEMTDEEKQELRADFIEKAKDMQLAWISPRVQMDAGVDAGEIECREGYSLVMKESNGVGMCLKADTALTMIERGLAVPAN